MIACTPKINVTIATLALALSAFDNRGSSSVSGVPIPRPGPMWCVGKKSCTQPRPASSTRPPTSSYQKNTALRTYQSKLSNPMSQSHMKDRVNKISG
uniref:Secreted protein n=1 Tax=Rhipicephalus zambeziensis TaxID=60191 RepID=A0A224YG29_9ACAR